MSKKSKMSKMGMILSSLANETEAKFPGIYSRHQERIQFATKSTTHYPNLRRLHPDLPPVGESKTIVEVANGDTLDVALGLKEEGLEPLVLNMASSFKPGGGWRNGARAQEESLFYRSTYAISLENCLGLDERDWHYPLDPFSGVYSPDIYVFRENAQQNYAFLRKKDCFWVDMVAVAAIRRPKLTKSGNLTERDQSISYSKIEGIFKIALEKKHDSLVLGAFGCGAYQNPPEDIAKIFQLVIANYGQYFKKISFAIIEDRNSQGNLEIFRRVFCE